MKRLALLLVASALLCVRGAPASAGDSEAPPDSLRIHVERDSLVHIDLRVARENLPSLRGDVPVVWRGQWLTEVEGFGLRPVTGDHLSFLAVAGATYEIRASARPRAGALEEAGAGATLAPYARFVDDDESWFERIESSSPSRAFGAVAAAAPAVYDPKVADVPRWYLAKIEPRGTTDLPLVMPRGSAAEGSDAALEIVVFGTHEGVMRIGARWGDKSLGEQEFPSAAGPHSFLFVVPAKDVDGAKVVHLEDLSPVPPPADARDVSDDRGALWVADAYADIRAKAHPGPRVVLRDDLNRRVRIEAIDGTPLLVPHRDPPDPVAAAKRDNEVILATAALLPAARRLAAHRTSSGIRAVAIPVADVWDRVNAGDAKPEAIRDYFALLAKDRRGPRFVLLCGDATFDRTDLVRDIETIPTLYARTKYNGATASDRLFVLPEGKDTGGPAIGRLPFRDPKDMEAYVDRVIAYETKPPADPTRRILRFVTSEGRFGPLIDTLTEKLFTGIVANSIPPAYDVEVTFASETSAFLWAPPEFNAKVVGDIDEGALTFTYVGHGWWDGFDDLRWGGKRFPILRNRDASQIAVKGTPPAMFVVACTTARFDDPETTSVGERLLAQPHGPIAYWGSTRICHPAWNAVVGRQIALGLFASKDARVGEILRDAADRAVANDSSDAQQRMIRFATAAMAPGEDMDRLYREGSLMYGLLGDPAIRLALPDDDLNVEATAGEKSATATVSAEGLPAGAEIHLSLEMPRDAMPDLPPEAKAGATDAERFAAIRARHDRANDKSLARATVVAKGGKASADLPIPEAWRGKPLVVKAWTIAGGRVRQGAVWIGL